MGTCVTANGLSSVETQHSEIKGSTLFRIYVEIFEHFQTHP